MAFVPIATINGVNVGFEPSIELTTIDGKKVRRALADLSREPYLCTDRANVELSHVDPLGGQPKTLGEIGGLIVRCYQAGGPAHF